MYDGPGERVPVVNDTGANIPNNTPRFIGGHVGWVEKNQQIDRWTRPDSEAATHVMAGEPCVCEVTGVHELALIGLLANAEVGNRLWFDCASQTVVTSGAAGGAGAANEVQSYKLQATGGVHKVTWDAPGADGAQTTKAIPFAASAKEFQAALEELASVQPGDIVVTGGPGNEAGTTPYILTFGGQYADMDVPAVTADATGLTGGEHKVVITTSTAGAGGADEIVPLGVVDEVDLSRTPHIGRVNTTDLKPFITAG